MSVLSMEARAKVAACLVDGVSIRATERITSAHRDTVMRLGVALGEGCALLHDRLVRAVSCPLLQADEAWTFVHTKNSRVTSGDPSEWGDQYVYIGLDVTSRAIISFAVGKRDAVGANAFAMDLRGRIVGRPQISTDGWGPYPEAIWQAFGYEVDFARVVKNYRQGAKRGPDHRYEPPRDPFITRTAEVLRELSTLSGLGLASIDPPRLVDERNGWQLTAQGDRLRTHFVHTLRKKRDDHRGLPPG